MKMKSHRPLLVNGEPQTEFETNEHHGKELIAKGLAVEVTAVDASIDTPDENTDDSDPKSLTVPQLKEALTAKGIAFEATAKKADLQALLDAAH